MKPKFEENETALFERTNIHITTGGTRHLGAVIGSKECRDDFVIKKVNTWVNDIKTMADIATTQPHAVYSAMVHGGLSRWLFIAKTIPDIEDLMQPLEDSIYRSLLSTITGRPPCSKIERDISALPSRLKAHKFTVIFQCLRNYNNTHGELNHCPRQRKGCLFVANCLTN